MTKKYVWGMLLSVFAVIGFFVPFAILFISKYDEWVTTAETTSISTAVMLGLIYGILVLRGALKDLSREASALISMFAFLAIVYFLDSILNDLFFIILSIIGGYIVFIILSKWGKRQKELAKEYDNENIRIIARNQVQENELRLKNKAIRGIRKG